MIPTNSTEKSFNYYYYFVLYCQYIVQLPYSGTSERSQVDELESGRGEPEAESAWREGAAPRRHSSAVQARLQLVVDEGVAAPMAPLSPDVPQPSFGRSKMTG